MLDVLNYEMTAYDQKVQFNDCQKEMTAAYKKSQAFPLRRLLELFPALATSRRDILRRGPIRFSRSSKYAESVFANEQMLSFGDPALGQVYFTVPGRMTSRVELDESRQSLELVLIDRMEMNVNKLAEEGLNRSAFQIVKRMKFQKDVVVTVLEDVVAPPNITNLIVYLNDNSTSRLTKSQILNVIAYSDYQINSIKTLPVRNLDEVTCCDGLTGGGNWIAYKLAGDPEPCVCHVKEGRCGLHTKYEVIKEFSEGETGEKEATDWVKTSGRCS